MPVGVDSVECYEVIAAGAALRRRLTSEELDGALEAMADFTDLRSPCRAGHSQGVGRLAGDAAELAGLPAAEVRAVRRAGLLHDVGMHGVPGTILNKPGPLTATESERPGSAIPMTARVLAAACAYQAMIEPRPHRPAPSPTLATAELRSEVRAGRPAADAVDAVHAATGRGPARRRVGPAGLTSREREVLALIARGATTRLVAQTLGTSTKPAGTHIERSYAKTGASTRATATLFALQHGLLDTASARFVGRSPDDNGSEEH